MAMRVKGMAIQSGRRNAVGKKHAEVLNPDHAREYDDKGCRNLGCKLCLGPETPEVVEEYRRR